MIFGITGDLAKVMTFRSALPPRETGAAQPPGDGCRRRRLGERSAARACSGVDRGNRREIRRPVSRPLHRSAPLCPGRLLGMPRRTNASRTHFAAGHGRCSTSRSHRLSSGRRQGLAEAGLTSTGRVVVEKPFGHDLPNPRCARCPASPVHRRVPALPNRPLPRKDGAGRVLYLRFANATLEPIWHRTIWVGTVHDGRIVGVEDRGHFYDPVGALRDVVVNHLMQLLAAAAMEPPAGGDPDSYKDAKLSVFRSMRSADPEHYVRGQYEGYREIAGVARGLDDRDVCGAAARHRELALGRRPLLHPHRQAPAGQTDRAAAGVQAPAAARLQSTGTQPEPNPARRAVPIDRRSGVQCHLADRRAAHSGRPIELDMEFAEEGGEGADPLRGAAAGGDASATAAGSPARTASRRAGG